jgi:hypothetical protein
LLPSPKSSVSLAPRDTNQSLTRGLPLLS